MTKIRLATVNSVPFAPWWVYTCHTVRPSVHPSVCLSLLARPIQLKTVRPLRQTLKAHTASARAHPMQIICPQSFDLWLVCSPIFGHLLCHWRLEIVVVVVVVVATTAAAAAVAVAVAMAANCKFATHAAQDTNSGCNSMNLSRDGTSARADITNL